MFKNVVRHSITLSIAGTVLFGASAMTAHAAIDDMDAVSAARQLVGSDYAKGEETPKGGFDAAGLVYYIFDQLGYNIPRTLSAQLKMDKPSISSLSSVQPGDVVFFGTKTSRYNGIYIGNNQFVYSSPSKDEVVTKTIGTYEKSHFLGARRILSKADQKRVNIILDARKYLGTPYVFGAKYGQTDTFDCSSFVKTVFTENGITSLPRVSRDQAKKGTYVSKSNLTVGDLVFFTTKDSGGKIGHVGIYAGNGMMIHTYGDGGVKYSSINSDWWSDHYVTGRRLIAD